MPKVLMIFDTPDHPSIDMLMFAMQTSFKETLPGFSCIFERREPSVIIHDVGKAMLAISKSMKRDLRSDRALDFCIHFVPREVTYRSGRKESSASILLLAIANRRHIIGTTVRMGVNPSEADMVKEILVRTSSEIAKALGEIELTEQERIVGDKIRDAITRATHDAALLKDRVATVQTGSRQH